MAHIKYYTSYILFALLIVAQTGLCEELPEGFYNEADGKQDGALKDELKSLIRDHKAIPYGTGATSTWGVFYYSDRDEEGYCMDMYCDDWYKFTTPGAAVTGCNIEHSFAKSWWGGSNNDAYKDCYHLNPSNSQANSARSNYPLGVPEKDIKTAGSLRVGKKHHPTLDVDFSVFEPKDEYKGDFARAYFYMATCYGHWSNGEIDPVLSSYNGWRLDNKDVGSKFAMQNDNYLEFQPWEQEVLIQWHRQDPVSIKEIRRMDAVSDFQHNRNPFIDYPYLAEYIWGEHMGEPVDMSLLVASSDEAFIPGVSNGWREGGAPTVKPKYGVSWSVNDEIIQVDSITQNKKIPALPETPLSCSVTSDCFMGWTTAPIQGTTDEAPDKLYLSATDIPSVTADITYYAVFAQKTVIDGGDPATYVFDEDHQAGWTTDAENKSGYWLLDEGKTLVSPEVNLSGLSAISVRIRTYGGKEYNQLDIHAGDQLITSFVTTTGSTLTDYTWTNTGTLSGKAALTFSCPNGGSKKGIGISDAIIEATGIRVLYTDYHTSCNQSGIEGPTTNDQRPMTCKFIRNGQLFILVGEQIYTVTGQRVR